MSSCKKISWKMLVLIALVSSFIFCSEVCAGPNCQKNVAQTEQKEGTTAVKAEQKSEGKEAKVAQKEEIKAIKAEQKCERKEAKAE